LTSSALPDETFAGVFEQPAPTPMARDQSVKFLLDTNVISEIRKRDRADANVARWGCSNPKRIIVNTLACRSASDPTPFHGPNRQDFEILRTFLGSFCQNECFDRRRGAIARILFIA